jgi:hypothetical protein
MILTLTHEEYKNLADPKWRRGNPPGGYQNLIETCLLRTNPKTKDIHLDQEIFERIHRYAFAYGSGGWEDGLTGIFGRLLGPKLDKYLKKKTSKLNSNSKTMKLPINEMPEYNGPGYTGSITVSIELISPEQAQSYLNNNYDLNRNIIKSRVLLISSQINNNEWQLNGASICFTKSGWLLDGQHRLQAIVQSGKTVWTVVVRGIDDDAFMTIDTGRARGLSDILHMVKEADTNALAATCRLVYSWELQKSFTSSPSRKPTTADIQELLSRHPSIRDAVRRFCNISSFRRVSRSFLSAFYYLVSDIDGAEAEIFYDHLLNGTNLLKGHPVLALRNLLEYYKDSHPGRARFNRLNSIVMGKFFVKTWNAFANGRMLVKLYLAEDEKADHLEKPIGTAFARYNITKYAA